MSGLRPPRPPELKRVWRMVGDTGLFHDGDELREELSEWPFRVLVAGGRYDLRVVVSRPWREGRPVLGVQFMACSASQRAATVAAIAPAARDHGFETVLSPMLSDADAAPFVANGYAPSRSVVVMDGPIAGDGVGLVGGALPRGVTVGPALPKHLDGVLAVDAVSFDDFWRYGKADLCELAPRHVTLVALDENEQVVGYTMGSVAGRQGNLVRLAVSPPWRRHAVASGLVAAMASQMRGLRAVRMMLCTQVENTAAQHLYGRLGFRQMGAPLSIYARDS